MRGNKRPNSVGNRLRDQQDGNVWAYGCILSKGILDGLVCCLFVITAKQQVLLSTTR